MNKETMDIRSETDATTALCDFLLGAHNFFRLVNGKDRGREAWHVVVIPDPDIRRAIEIELDGGGSLNMLNYGTIFASGWVSEKSGLKITCDTMETVNKALIIRHCSDDSWHCLKVNEHKRALLENLRLVCDDAKAIRSFGELLHSGWGQDPPEVIAIPMLRNYFRIGGGENLESKPPNFTLCEFARKRNIKIFKTLYSGVKIDIKEVDVNHWTLLHHASFGGKIEIIEPLLGMEWSVHDKDNAGRKPIHIAAREGFASVVKLFLRNGIGVDDEDKYCWTLLHYATWGGHLQAVNLLLDEGAKIDATEYWNQAKAIHLAAREGHTEIVEMLLRRGVAVNDTDRSGRSPLYYAAMRGHMSTVKLLVDKGADLYCKTVEELGGKMAIHIAVLCHHTDIVMFLIEKSKNLLNMQSTRGLTPLRFADSSGHESIIKYLIDEGALIHLMDANELHKDVKRYEYLSLHTAANSGDLDAVKLYIEAGFGMKHIGTESQTVLHSAALSNEKEVLQFILKELVKKQECLNINVPDKRDGSSPLMWAASHGKQDSVQILLESDADIDFQSKPYNNTALHLATEKGHLEVVKILVDRGANINLRNGDEKTAIHYAAMNKNEAIIKLLIARNADVVARDNKGKTPSDYAGEIQYLFDEAVKERKTEREEANHSAEVNNNPAPKIDVRRWRENNTENEHWKLDEALGDFFKTLKLRIVTSLCGGKEAWSLVLISLDPNVERAFEEACGGLMDIEIIENYGLVLNSGWVFEGTKPSESVKDTLLTDLIIRNLDNGTWCYFVVKKYKEAFLEDRHLDWNNEDVILKYSEMLHSGWGKDPPEVIIFKILLAYVQHESTKGLESDCSNNILNRAARENDQEPFALSLITQNEIDEVDVNGWTLLHHAAFGGNLQIIKTVLKMELSVHDEDTFGRQPIHIAAREGFESVIEIFLDENVDVDAEDEYRWTALHYAAWGGRLAAVNLLLEKGASIDATEAWSSAKAIHLAAREGHMDVVKALLRKGAAVDATDIRGRTPLYYAVWKSHISLVQFLIDERADMYCDKLGGKLAIHIAAVYGFTNIVQILLKNFKDLLNAKSSEGGTALCYADYNGCKDTVKFLINKGAYIYDYSTSPLDNDVEDRYIYLSLHAAAMKGDLDSVKHYINEGVGTNHIGTEYLSVLHSAVLSDEKEVVEFVIKELVIKQRCLPIDVTLDEEHGVTPLMIAAQHGKQNSVETLLEYHANIDFLNELSPYSALHFAVLGRHQKVVEILVDKGANINLRDRTGQTPLHFASRNRDEDMIKFLIDNNADIGVRDSDGKMPSDYASDLFQSTSSAAPGPDAETV